MVEKPENKNEGSPPDSEGDYSTSELEMVALERHRQESDARFRERELKLQQEELDLKRQELSRKQWHNPLFVGLIVAIIGIMGNVVVSIINGVLERERFEQQAIQADIRQVAEQDLEAQKAGFELIQQALSNSDREQAYRSLLELIDLGLVRDRDESLRKRLLSKIQTNELPQPTSRPAATVGTLPHVNLGMIGDLQLAPLLTSSITKVLAEKGTGEFVAPMQLRNQPEEKSRGIAVTISHLEYRTDRRHYTQVICGLDLTSCVKSIIIGAAQMDGAVLAVSVERGITEEVRQLVALAQAVRVPALVVFIDIGGGVSDDEAMKLQTGIRQLMTQHGFPGANVPVVRGSVEAALSGEDSTSIQNLIDVVDVTLPLPIRPRDRPFLMPVEDVFAISGRGTVVTGRVERGTIKVGEEVESVGLKETRETTVMGVEMFRKLLDFGEPGDNIGVLLGGVGRDDVVRGQVLAKPGSITAHTNFKAETYILTAEEGGRKTPFFSNYRPQFYFRTTEVTGVVTLPEGTELVMPGDIVPLDVRLIAPIAMEEGLRFAIRENGRTIGAGLVTSILP